MNVGFETKNAGGKSGTLATRKKTTVLSFPGMARCF